MRYFIVEMPVEGSDYYKPMAQPQLPVTMPVTRSVETLGFKKMLLINGSPDLFRKHFYCEQLSTNTEGPRHRWDPF